MKCELIEDNVPRILIAVGITFLVGTFFSDNDKGITSLIGVLLLSFGLLLKLLRKRIK